MKRKICQDESHSCEPIGEILNGIIEIGSDFFKSVNVLAPEGAAQQST